MRSDHRDGIVVLDGKARLIFPAGTEQAVIDKHLARREAAARLGRRVSRPSIPGFGKSAKPSPAMAKAMECGDLVSRKIVVDDAAVVRAELERVRLELDEARAAIETLRGLVPDYVSVEIRRQKALLDAVAERLAA